MKNEAGQPQAKSPDARVLLYIGEDMGFWKDLQEGFKAFKQIPFDFQADFAQEPKKIQNFLVKIHQDKPRVVFIDLSKHTEAMLHLLRAQSRMNSTAKPFIIALTSFNQGEDVIRQAITAGCQCVHVKSGETEAVVYDAMCFAFHSALEDHGFAMAKMNDEVQAFIPAKASVVSSSGLRVESNYKVEPGGGSLLNTYWFEQGILKSKLARMGYQESKDLYYSFTYAQELGFEFVNRLDLPEGMEEQKKEELASKRAQELEASKQAMLKWIQKEKGDSCPKVLKTLVIDKDLTLYTDSPLTDSYPFVIRVQPYLVRMKQELTQYMPQMIAYNMEHVDEEEVQANADLAHMFNEGNNLQYLAKIIKSIQDFDPYIIVFNTDHDTKKLQGVLEYPNVIGHKEPLSSDLIIKMAQLLQGKLFGKEDPFGENVVVLNKKSPATYAEFETAVSLVGCSENDLYFNSEEEFEVGTTLRLKVPANMYITVAEAPKSPKASSRYYALIHGIGEEEKKELRRFVNSVFFREKEAAKLKEREEVQKLKEKYLEASEQQADQGAQDPTSED